jgi:arginine:pyruvate transaminase
MRFAPIVDRLSGLGGAKWAVHARAKEMIAQGRDVIKLSIGEPDVPPADALLAAAKAGIDAGRLGYSNGRGEPNLLAALAARYSKRTHRTIAPSQCTALPGTQTTLFATLTTLVGPGDEVLLGDPCYATYEGLIAATGATVVMVPLHAETGFRMQAADVAPLITPRTRLLFLNTPHNPTGAILTEDDIRALGNLAIAHDLWILSDEVYEEMIYEGARFVSPFDMAELADRTVVAASISKSHAAPGFRSGWCVGPQEFSDALLPVAETMLFGNQPFIADMTAMAVSAPSEAARGMAQRFARRAGLVQTMLHGKNGLVVHKPEAGMFALVNIAATGLSGEQFALGLLEGECVAVMPGESFGNGLAGWLRLSLTVDDALIHTACTRIAAYAARAQGLAA